MDRIFLSVIPLPIARRFTKPFLGVGSILAGIFPELGKNLHKLDLDVDENEYFAIGFLSYNLLGLVLGLGMTRFLVTQNIVFSRAFLVGFLIWILVVFILLFMSAKHPVNTSTERAKQIDKTLIYSLRDLSLQLSSGETLFQGMVNVSKADYGESSDEFKRIVKKLNVGIPMQIVLRERIKIIESEFLRKAYWQLINSLRAGADLKKGLNSIVLELDSNQKTNIQNYARELGLWSLVYMMFSVAIPTIGLTMLVILSAFAGGGVGESTFISFLVMNFMIQIGLIVFIKSRRPVVQF